MTPFSLRLGPWLPLSQMLLPALNTTDGLAWRLAPSVYPTAIFQYGEAPMLAARLFRMSTVESVLLHLPYLSRSKEVHCLKIQPQLDVSGQGQV